VHHGLTELDGRNFQLSWTRAHKKSLYVFINLYLFPDKLLHRFVKELNIILCCTWSDNKVRELIAAKVLHTLLLNFTMVTYKVLCLESYASMPSPSPPFKTILELVLWNGLQSCRYITPDVIKMPPFPYFLYLREQKSHWGLDPVNREGIPAQLFVY
jgi:hypothetical protein